MRADIAVELSLQLQYFYGCFDFGYASGACECAWGLHCGLGLGTVGYDDRVSTRSSISDDERVLTCSSVLGGAVVDAQGGFVTKPGCWRHLSCC